MVAIDVTLGRSFFSSGGVTLLFLVEVVVLAFWFIGWFAMLACLFTKLTKSLKVVKLWPLASRSKASVANLQQIFSGLLCPHLR